MRSSVLACHLRSRTSCCRIHSCVTWDNILDFQRECHGCRPGDLRYLPLRSFQGVLVSSAILAPPQRDPYFKRRHMIPPHLVHCRVAYAISLNRCRSRYETCLIGSGIAVEYTLCHSTRRQRSNIATSGSKYADNNHRTLAV